MVRQAICTLTDGPMTIHSVFDSQGRRIAEYNETSGALIREYVWNGWEPVALIEGGVVYFVRVDHIGRPVFATNASGVTVWTASYLPFGEVHVATGALPDNRFPGQWYQSESGLHQNWMRDYDPTTGRYLQADPLGLVDGASVYGYVRQNPGRWVDPRGEFIPLLWLFGSIVVGEVIEYIADSCNCNSSASERWIALGATAEIFGPTIRKPFSPFGSSTHTSLFSAAIGEAGLGRTSLGFYGRKFGKRISKRLPYIGIVMSIWDAGNLWYCLSESSGKTNDDR